MHGRSDGWTDGHSLLQRCEDTSKKLEILYQMYPLISISSLYMRLCPFVGWSVRWSVGTSDGIRLNKNVQLCWCSVTWIGQKSQYKIQFLRLSSTVCHILEGKREADMPKKCLWWTWTRLPTIITNFNFVIVTILWGLAQHILVPIQSYYQVGLLFKLASRKKRGKKRQNLKND